MSDKELVIEENTPTTKHPVLEWTMGILGLVIAVAGSIHLMEYFDWGKLAILIMIVAVLFGLHIKYMNEEVANWDRAKWLRITETPKKKII